MANKKKQQPVEEAKTPVKNQQSRGRNKSVAVEPETSSIKLKDNSHPVNLTVVEQADVKIGGEQGKRKQTAVPIKVPLSSRSKSPKIVPQAKAAPSNA